MDKGFKFIGIDHNVITLESKHKSMYIYINSTACYITIKDKKNKNNKNYKWIYIGYNDIPNKYQDLVEKHVVMYKLL